jgi:hypothetical protein
MLTQNTSGGPLAKIFSLLAGAILLVLGLMFSLVLVGAVAVLGLGVWAWFWWKTRKLRAELSRQMNNPANGYQRGPSYEPSSAPSSAGTVIDGEAVVVEESFTRSTSNRLPASPDRHSPD